MLTNGIDSQQTVSSDPIELFIPIEEFAQRMRISRSTAYEWIASGKLEVGRHVMHIGKIIRIAWSNDLVRHLMKQSVVRAPRPVLKRNGKGGRNCCALDSDYLYAH